jgi:hypothetical protein
MKKQILGAAVICWLAAGLALPASGQNATVKVKVPFHFLVGNKIYTAGEYAFSSEKEKVILEKADGTRLMMLLANHVSGSSGSKNGKVVFECYAEQCFLSQVWVPGQDDGRQLLRSRREMRVGQNEQGKYMALLGIETK